VCTGELVHREQTVWLAPASSSSGSASATSLPPFCFAAGLALAAAGAMASGLAVGPDRYCSPRHRMTFNSRNEGSKCVSMTWRGREWVWEILLASS